MLTKNGCAVRLADVSDARAIAACFDEVYEGTYPYVDFTRPERLARRLAARTTILAIAVEDGAVVGAVGLVLGENRTGDFGNGVVRPTHRGLDLFALLHRPLIDEARALGLATVFSHCVTSHVRSQRAMPRLGGKPVGLALAAAPRSLRFAGLADELSQRESLLECAFPFAARSAAIVHVPRDLAGVVELVYGSLGIRCDTREGGSSRELLRHDVLEDRELGTATLRFDVAGSSRGTTPADELFERPCLSAEVPLASADAPRVASELRARGFSFGGVLPGKARDGGDVLLLQRPREIPREVPIQIGIPGGEPIRRAVFDDLAAIRGAVLS